MAVDLSRYGIENPIEILHNPSYDALYNMELDSKLEGYERGQLTELGAVNVDTGIFTGRSPKDKYIVKNAETEKHVWWHEAGKKSSDNKPMTQETWDYLKKISAKQLSGKRLFVSDCFCGANENTRIKVRFIAEVAWQAHFVKNMFIRPTEEELKTFEPDFVVLVASKTKNDKWKEQGLNSEVFAAFHITERMACIGGTWYGGEMKKGIFSMMNYFLPLRGIASMHCSANMGKKGDVAIFFGLSGTGKTTLSADPHRELIGDDEHGWDDNGVFNFEGGCYEGAGYLRRHTSRRASGESGRGREGENRLFVDEEDGEYARIVPHIPHKEYRKARFEGGPCAERYFPNGRRFWGVAPRVNAHAGPDAVPLFKRFHR